jgi:hypothetical protein
VLTNNGGLVMRGKRINSSTLTAATASLLLVLALAEGGAQASDTTIIRAAAPLYRGVAVLREELTVGNGSSAAEYQFTMPYVFSGPSGGVYVVDVSDLMDPRAYNTTIREYDRTGKFVRAIGRTGQGPGEHSGIVSDVKRLGDGRVLVLERRGVLVYDSSGVALTQWPIRDYLPRGLLMDPAGFVHVHGVSMVRLGTSTPALERFTLDGRPVERLAHPEAAFPAPPMVAGGLLPFGARYLVKWSPLGYFVTANTANYAVDLRRTPPQPGVASSGVSWGNGDPIISIRRNVPPIPLSAAERADWRQSITMYRRRQIANWDWDGPDIPSVKPAISGLQIATDGRIWVRVSQPAVLNPAVSIRASPGREGFVGVEAGRRWFEPGVYDVFEPSGQYVGQVRFPAFNTPAHLPPFDFAIEGDTVWGVVYDQDEVPSVKRYRVTWGG